jgi:hypothetical protein
MDPVCEAVPSQGQLSEPNGKREDSCNSLHNNHTLLDLEEASKIPMLKSRRQPYIGGQVHTTGDTSKPPWNRRRVSCAFTSCTLKVLVPEQ